MALIRDEAVVLARLDYSETSQVLVLFTRQHGKVRAIAKGIRRGTKARFAVGTDLLDVGTVVVSSRQERSANLATVTEWKQTRSLSGLRETLARLRGAEYAIEITTHLTEDWDPHFELFDSLLSTLTGLSEASEPLPLVVAYQLSLLDAVGSHPRFDTCVLCGRRDGLTHLSAYEGGMICRHCEAGQVEKWAVSPGTLEKVSRLATRSPPKPQPLARSPSEPQALAAEPGGLRVSSSAFSASTDSAFGLLNYYIAHLMGREPLLASKVVPSNRRRVVE